MFQSTRDERCCLCGATILAKIHWDTCVQKNVIVTIHKIAQINVTPTPLPVQCWLEKIKSKLGLVQMIINIVWGEDFDFSEGNLISELILSLLSQSLFPGL